MNTPPSLFIPFGLLLVPFDNQDQEQGKLDNTAHRGWLSEIHSRTEKGRGTNGEQSEFHGIQKEKYRAHCAKSVVKETIGK